MYICAYYFYKKMLQRGFPYKSTLIIIMYLRAEKIRNSKYCYSLAHKSWDIIPRTAPERSAKINNITAYEMRSGKNDIGKATPFSVKLCFIYNFNTSIIFKYFYLYENWTSGVLIVPHQRSTLTTIIYYVVYLFLINCVSVYCL